jgi:hypothetical protein
MITYDVAVSLIEDLIVKVGNNEQIADPRESRIMMDVQSLREMRHEMEEIFAYLQMFNNILHIKDAHGGDDSIILYPTLSPHTITVDLNLLWGDQCPICEHQETSGAGEKAVCLNCGFPFKFGWQKNEKAIEHWAFHYSQRRENIVERFVDALSPLRMD